MIHEFYLDPKFRRRAMWLALFRQVLFFPIWLGFMLAFFHDHHETITAQALGIMIPAAILISLVFGYHSLKAAMSDAKPLRIDETSIRYATRRSTFTMPLSEIEACREYSNGVIEIFSKQRPQKAVLTISQYIQHRETILALLQPLAPLQHN